ncbi:hypothetical protein [Methanobrevibacter sp.]|uniref:hypothetical protein n=1 Tax=Methanobrevibacter sp. TaxID=66852 RepID=UPI0025CFC7F7|nr:hypothetical protein [Methanobrevibacter sp.]MBQ2962752.1 hypothetical protein [Methanobrevibacter sp.]
MNFNLFLTIIIALIILFSIILYNGLRILLTVEKDKSMVEYELKATILKIPIFTRTGTNGNDDKTENDDTEDSADDLDETLDEDKGLKEKYEEIKPIINGLIKSKEELKDYLNKLLKTIDLKKLEGNLVIGLGNHTTTVKIASWIWSIGAILNSTNPSLLTVEPKFTEEIIDFEGKLELKINLLFLLAYSMILLTEKNIRELIKEIIG